MANFVPTTLGGGPMAQVQPQQMKSSSTIKAPSIHNGAYAGPSFSNAPAPYSLPKPVFFVNDSTYSTDYRTPDVSPRHGAARNVSPVRSDPPHPSDYMLAELLGEAGGAVVGRRGRASTVERERWTREQHRAFEAEALLVSQGGNAPSEADLKAWIIGLKYLLKSKRV